MIKGSFESLDVACAGVDDKMFIFVTDSTIKNEVKQFVSLKTGLNSVAFCVIEIPEIPKTDSGKTLYKELENIMTFEDIINIAPYSLNKEEKEAKFIEKDIRRPQRSGCLLCNERRDEQTI